MSVRRRAKPVHDSHRAATVGCHRYAHHCASGVHIMQAMNEHFSRRLWALLPDIEAAGRRFPVSVLAGILLCAFIFLTQIDFAFFSQPPSNDVQRFNTVLMSAGLTGLFWLTAVAFWVESGCISRRNGIVLGFAGAAAIAGLAAASEIWPHWAALDPLRLMVASLLTVAVSSAVPVSGQAANVRILKALLAIAAASVIALVIFGGVFGPDHFELMSSASAAALSKFDSFAPGAKAVAIGLGLTYFFNWLPASGDASATPVSESENPTSSPEFSRRLLIPFVLVILSILSFNFINAVTRGGGFITINGRAEYPLELSNALLIIMVVPYLFLWPSRGGASPLLRWFVRWWPALMIVPLAFGAVALIQALNPWVHERIRVHGAMFEFHNRTSAGIWALGVALAVLWMPRFRDLRLLVGAFAAMLALTSFGPWGAIGFAQRHNFRQLQGALTHAEYLSHGQIVGQGEIPADSICPDAGALVPIHCRMIIVGALRDLAATRGLGLIESWFDGVSGNPFVAYRAAIPRHGIEDYELLASLTKRFAPTITPEMPVAASVNRYFSFSQPDGIPAWPVAGYEHVAGPINFSQNGTAMFDGPSSPPTDFRFDAGSTAYRVVAKYGRITVTNTASNDGATFDFSGFAHQLTTAQDGGKPPGAILQGTGPLKLSLVVMNLSGHLDAKGDVQDLAGQAMLFIGTRSGVTP
jgi:hypothetical protein